MNFKDSDKILIRGVNWVGDAVMTMPAVRALRDHFTDKHISILLKPWVGDLFRKDPNINNIIGFSTDHKGIKGRLKLVQILKAEEFDSAILFQNALDAAILAFLSRIKNRIGYNTDARSLLLTKSVHVDDKLLSLHQVNYYLNLLKAAGIDAPYRLPWIYMDIDDRIAARNRLSTLKHPIIGINPGSSGGTAKRWPAERFASVISLIISELNGSAVIFGGNAESPLAKEIISLIDGDLVTIETLLDFTGKTTIGELPSIVSECDLLLTNDSGIMHIGYAVGVPMIAVFGPTSHILTGPPIPMDDSEFNYKRVVIDKSLPCSPCFKLKCKFGSPACLINISALEVFETIKKIIPKNKAIFFDRDGTLCKDAHYLNDFKDLHIFPEVKDLIKFKEKGYKLIGISNQSGIGRGIVSESFTKEVNRIFIDKYGFDDFYYCPHLPDERCACRKPQPGMLLAARAKHDIDFKKSLVVGDKDADIMSAAAVGAAPIYIETSHYEQTIKNINKINNLNDLQNFIP
ncbi:MAG: lipopolysaccharide heptosyltransferase II [Nitrospirae bacterium]|nr:lipopolysaccharide heptosyltransferase II [Nitrospirota bacterium]MBF0540781.1 lipopolysaccharide heptosyltransferase II [Nitrospirota bacterium]